MKHARYTICILILVLFFGVRIESASAGTIIRAPVYLGLNAGLVGCWNFDGSYTKVPDCSGNGNTGTLNGGPTKKTGKVGQALSFDGVNDSIDTPSAGHAAPCTVAAWVNQSARVSGGAPITDGFGGGGTTYSLRAEQFGGDNVGITQYGTADYTFSPTFSVPLNTWTHLTFVVNTGTATLYANGIERGTISQTLACPADNIGGGGSDFVPGLIDDVRVYNRALSASEINKLYQMGR